MKTTAPTHLNKASIFTGLAAAALLFITPYARAANYAGNGNTGFGGPVGNGVLTVTDDHTNITVNLQRGSSGNLNDELVIYVDTGIGGPTDTSGYTSTGGTEQQAISGFDGSNRSVLTFTNGFHPAYAVVIKPDYMDVFSLANPASFNYLTGASQGGASTNNFTLTFNCATLGLATNTPATIRLFGTLLNNSGAYRSTEAIAGNIAASSLGQGPHPFTNTAYATYTFAQAVVPTYAVKFSVDMTAAAQLGNFVPGTDSVYCGGSFQATPFTFSSFQLVQSNGTDIYTNTYQDANLTNTLESYKFMFTSVAGATNSYDNDPNRTFTLQSGGQVVPLVYFNNIPASPSATTNYITFQVDMGPQIYAGHFNPGAGDVVSVSGSFEHPNWTGNFAPVGFLTNNPTLSGNASNIYSGTFADGNYPGTETQYKYVTIPAGGTALNYESGANRALVTPAGAATLPLAYFSGLSTYASVPITFSVDMTVPIVTGQFNPANGDTAGCAGTFETNSVPGNFAVGPNGFTLTNNPSLTGTASNIFSGTYIDRNAPGSAEQYKFVINPGGSATGTIYEEPSSTGGANRTFILGGTAATNPLVLWGDRSPNDVVLVPTTVTFQVNMTNAVDRWGVPFNPDTDLVMVDGDFTTPAFQVMSDFADATIQEDFPTYIMSRDTPTGLTYSLSFVLPAGNPVKLNYKYGILRNAGTDTNTNIDNEAGFAQNHTRYIRTQAAVTSYSFPLDIFGEQILNPAGAAEPPFGLLGIGNPTRGVFPINWLGLRGVHLQFTTNLVGNAWQDLNATDGTDTTNWPTTNGTGFFRLVQPVP